MATKYGVTTRTNQEPIIEQWVSDRRYDYVIECKLINERNGNRLNRLTILDSDNNYKSIVQNGWSINQIVDSPFNWGGSHIRPQVTDPNGQTREVYKGKYGKSLFKGLSYHADIKALFQLLEEHSAFKSWCAVDIAEKDEIIKNLEQEIEELKEQLDSLQSNG